MRNQGMTTFDKMTMIALLLGAFMFLVVIFCLIVCSTLCLVRRLRSKEDDQECGLMDSAMNTTDFAEDGTTYNLVPRRGRHKRNDDNEEVFDMQVFRYRLGSEESPTTV